jgi:hypothetical protein
MLLELFREKFPDDIKFINLSNQLELTHLVIATNDPFILLQKKQSYLLIKPREEVYLKTIIKVFIL